MASPRKARRTGSVNKDNEDADEEVNTLDEAKDVIRQLKEKCRSQSQQILAWRRRLRTQEEATARADMTRASHLSQLSSQLLLLEARLLRKRRDIDMLLGQRDTTIARQARAISLLQTRLADAGLDATADIELDVDSPLDSLNDSDSAVVLEDDHIGSRCISSRSVFRSVSDAVEPINKHSRSRNNGFLRRPEVLETVYSVEEDADGEPVSTPSSVSTVGSAPALSNSENTPPGRRASYAKRASWTSSRTSALSGSIEYGDMPPTASSLSCSLERADAPPPLNTYNRVMSNHRSVTKPKDVKYKRINKAKSKSLEELRGRLKNWVDKGPRGILAFEHSEA